MFIPIFLSAFYENSHFLKNADKIFFGGESFPDFLQWKIDNILTNPKFFIWLKREV
jgi:hypothetical protein